MFHFSHLYYYIIFDVGATSDSAQGLLSVPLAWKLYVWSGGWYVVVETKLRYA